MHRPRTGDSFHGSKNHENEQCTSHGPTPTDRKQLPQINTNEEQAKNSSHGSMATELQINLEIYLYTLIKRRDSYTETI